MSIEASPLPGGYRMTELGPLAEDWQVVRLGEVVPPRDEVVPLPNSKAG